MKLLTNLIFEPKGKHDPALAYNIKDTVMSADGSRVYFALQDVPAGTALSNGEYWKLQIDLSSSKSAMDQALASFGNYAKEIGMRVKGETAKASGNLVSFLPDAGSLLQPVTVLEPKQQGSGDPYPAGGGRNKSIPFSSGTHNGVTFVVNGDGSVNVSGTATVETVLINEFYIPAGSYVVSGAPSGSSFAKYDMYIAQMHGDTGDNGTVVARSFDGTTETNFSLDTRSRIRFIIRIPAGAVDSTKVFYPMIRLASDIDTSYSPPSNIRPFIGYNTLGLTAAGDNLVSYAYAGGTVQGVTVTRNEDGYYTLNGKPTASGVALLASLALPAGTYTLALDVKGGSCSTDNQTAGQLVEATTNTVLTPVRPNALKSSYTLTEKTDVWVRLFVNQATTYDNWKIRISLAAGNNAAANAYQGKLHTVQIGQTVYGGRFDWLTGKLVAEWEMKTFDGTENWIRQANADGLVRFACETSIRVGNNENLEGTKLCSHAKEVINANTIYGASNKFAIYASGYVFVGLGIADTDDFKSYLAAQKAAGTPVQFAWKLATPIEIQLSPTIISAADPEQANTLYGDGSIEVEYVKPLHVSIEERVAAAVAAAMQT